MTVECTGLTDRWCPIHGDCTCEDVEIGGPDSEDCPLHGTESTHLISSTFNEFCKMSGNLKLVRIDKDGHITEVPGIKKWLVDNDGNVIGRIK
jgi:hypothetical protein